MGLHIFRLRLRPRLALHILFALAVLSALIAGYTCG